MVRIIFGAALLVLAQSTGAWASAPCSGADQLVVSAAVHGMVFDNRLNRYRISVAVENRGRARQATDVLQSVEIYDESGVKVDQKGIPPLRAGQTYTFLYFLVRSSEAGIGTTTLRFQLNVQGSPMGSNCRRAGGLYILTF